MDDAVHTMTMETSYPGEYLFVCPVDECGRTIVIKTVDGGGLTVISPGDPAVRHQGSHGMALSATLDPEPTSDPRLN